MNNIRAYCQSSIGKKQIVAISGIGLVLFLVAHLAGNLLIFSGPEALNSYAKKLHELGPILTVMRAGLILTFATHIIFTVKVVKENRKARQNQYKVSTTPERSLATKTMPLSGTIIALYLIGHLMDYTWQTNTISTVINGQDLGVYGMVVNSFLNPIRAIAYIIAMIAMGAHLTHAIQSSAQSFGVNHKNLTPKIKNISSFLGLVLAIGFISIPVYIYFGYNICGKACLL